MRHPILILTIVLTLLIATEASSTILTQLTTNPGTDWMPHWSPNGDTIVYASSPIIIDHPANATQDIWTIPATGGSPTKLTTYNGVDGYGPKYSPDGSRIMYGTSMNSRGLGLWSIPSSGGTPTKVYDSGANDFRTSWSPDGSQIAYRSETPNQTLWVVSSDGSGSGRIQLTSTGNYSDPVWHPDGSTIAFSSLPSATAPYSDLWTVPSIGGTITRLTNTPDWNEFAPTYSPSGEWIAFVSDKGGTILNWGIWVMPATGGKSTSIVEGYVSNPCWSPDGTKIAFEWATGDPNVATSYDRDIWIASDLPEPIPEPSTILLLTTGLGGILVYGKVKIRRKHRS